MCVGGCNDQSCNSMWNVDYSGFTHHLTAHMFRVELWDCAYILMRLFKINGEQLRSSFKALGVLFHEKHKSWKCRYALKLIIKLTDYRIIKASNSAETARAGVVMECKILPKYTDLYRPSHVIWEHTFFTISTKNV